MRIFSSILALLVMCCLLSAAAGQVVCSNYNGNCGDCVQQTGCGWCAGAATAGTHLSTCMAGTAAGPSASSCPIGNGATWRYGKSVEGSVIVDAKVTTVLPTGPEATTINSNSAPKCGSDACDWACNAPCKSTQSCKYNTDAGANQYSCECKTNPFKWLGMALATLIGVSIAIFCGTCCIVGGCIYWCCHRRRAPTHEHHHHHAQHYGAAYNPQEPLMATRAVVY